MSRKAPPAGWLDLSTGEFVTAKLARLAYGAVVLLAGLASLGIAVLGWRRSPVLGLGALLAGALVFLGTILLGRVFLEVALAVSRVARDTSEMVEHEAEIAVNTGRPPADALRPSAPPT